MRPTTLTTNAKLVIGALVLTMGLGSAAAVAQPNGRGQRGPGPRGMMGGPLAGLLGLQPDLPLRALNLTEAQQEQVRTIVQSHRDEGRAIADRAQAALQALRAASQGTVDEGAINQQGQVLGAAISEAALLRARVRAEIQAVLTPEQQAEASKIASDRQARMQERRQKFQQRQQQRQKQTPPQG